MHTDLKWRDFRVTLLNGASDTRRNTERKYNTVSMAEIFDCASKPSAAEKTAAKAIMPSSYAECDARVYATQQEKGSFVTLCADIDTGNASLQQIEAAAAEIFGDTAKLIYSTASAGADKRKWRMLIPLGSPVPYQIWWSAQSAFFNLLREHGIVPDEALLRPAQLMFLPNVPQEQRDSKGKPLFYECSLYEGPPVDLSCQPLAGAIQSVNELANAALAAKASAQAVRALRKAQQPAGQLSPIERFNDANPLDDVLRKYGYVQKHTGADDWRSPLQGSGSFATKAFIEPEGSFWVSFSASDADAGLGALTERGNRFGDAFDLFVHFQHGGNRAAALEAILDTSLTTPRDIAAQPYSPRRAASIPPRRWVIDRLLLGGTVTVLTAPGGSGKTTFTMALAIAIATGKPILDMTVWSAGNVWVWNLEDDSDELARVVTAACQQHDIDEEVELKGKLFLNTALDGSELCTATDGRDGITLRQPTFDKISAEIAKNGIRVLIIDPFVSSHAVEENSNTKIDKIVKTWARIARATDCAVIIVHHTSKAGAGDVNSSSARGASALTSAARGVLVINKMTAEQARTLGAPESERWRYFNVQDDKHSRAPAEQARWFEILSVSLENGDSVGVASPWTPPPDVALYSAEDVRSVQELGARQDLRRDFRAPDWIGHAIGGVIGLDSHEAANRGRLDRIARDWITRRYFTVQKRKDGSRKERDFLISEVVPRSLLEAIVGGAAVDKS